MPDPIPILFTIPNFITAGSGRAMLNIIERLDRTKFAPGVCVSRKGGDLDRVVESLEIPFIEAPFTVAVHPVATFPLRAWKAAQPFRAYRFALWHSFHYADDYTEPIIARMAGARAWVYTKKNMSWGRRSWRLRSHFATRIAAQNNDMLRDFFADTRFAHKTRLVQRGVVAENFTPDVPSRLGIRQQLQIAPDIPVAACVAHLVPVKGHPTLLNALAKAPGVHLLIAGKPLDTDYTALLKSLVCELEIEERVHFLGDIRDVPALLSEVDVVVLPTWAKWRMEGCPVALLEAMSCGRACIATDIPGSRDLLEHEKSGLIVPPENVEALAKALNRLSASPEECKIYGAAARARVWNQFRIEHEVAAHETLYKEILTQ